MIRQTLPTRVRAVGDNEVEVILSTGTLARDGHVLEPRGAVLDNYLLNPIVLWQHDPLSPVANASAIRVKSDCLTAKVTFAPLGVSAVADQVRGLVKSGVVSSLSVGFEPLDGVPLDAKRPRGGQIFKRWELLEASFVSVPADPRAIVTARAYGRGSMLSADASKNLIRLDEHISESLRHHADIASAMRRGDDDGSERSHRRLGQCLERARRCLRAIANDGMLKDIHNSQSLQTSSGVSQGVSSYLAPLSRAQRQAELLALSGPVVGDGGAVGCAAIRDREFIRAQARCAAVASAGNAFTREPSYAERQERVRQLARPFG